MLNRKENIQHYIGRGNEKGEVEGAFEHSSFRF